MHFVDFGILPTLVIISGQMTVPEVFLQMPPS
jgi:hypothetical protein